MRLLHRSVIALRGCVPPADERHVLRALRIAHLDRIDQVPQRGLRDAIRLAVRRASALSSFEAVFRTVTIERRSDEAVIVLGSSTLLDSSCLLPVVGDARQLTLLAVTLGPAWDEALDSLAARGESAEAWFLDALGTLIVDRAARIVEDQAAMDPIRQGLRRTGRYRPGWNDWHLAAQSELCLLVQAHRIGLRENEAHLLSPRKSVTGIMGWREEPATCLLTESEHSSCSADSPARR